MTSLDFFVSVWLFVWFSRGTLLRLSHIHATDAATTTPHHNLLLLDSLRLCVRFLVVSLLRHGFIKLYWLQ